MKFCHIEESGGQQVLFRVHLFSSIFKGVNDVVTISTYLNGDIKEKAFFSGSDKDCFEKVNTLDFQKDAYNFLTELASCR